MSKPPVLSVITCICYHGTVNQGSVFFHELLNCLSSNYHPQTKFAKVMFLQMSVILSTGGGHVWLLRGGACMVALGGMRGCLGGMRGCLGGHAWLLQGGMRGCSQGGMHGCSWGGVRGCSGAVCVAAPEGHVWLLPGGHAWLLRGGVHGFSDEIRSMSGRYASYWNAFLL